MPASTVSSEGAGAAAAPAPKDDATSGSWPVEGACDALDKSTTSALRNDPGPPVTTLRVTCRTRQLIISEPPLPGRAAALIELRRTMSSPGRAPVTGIVVAPAIPVGATAWAVALDAKQESDAVVAGPTGDVSGFVELADATHVDLVGSPEPELVVVLRAYEAATDTHRSTFIVCDSAGAWCTPAASLGESSNSRRTYSFRRHAHGVEVTTSGEPKMPVRLFRVR